LAHFLARPDLLLLLLVFGLALVGNGCAGPPKQPPAPPAPYTRVTRPDTNTIALEIALREFVPASGRGPTVWLSGVSHIGETNYYSNLQRHLDQKTIVLFEGVGARNKKLRFDPAEESSIQHTLATSLGLVFQLSAIDYDRAHFQNSDLTIPELQRLLAGEASSKEKPESGKGGEGEGRGSQGEESQQFQTLMGVMDGSSALGMIVHLGIKFIGSTPKLQAMMKLAMIETLGRFQGDLSEAKGIPPEMQRLMRVIIRNRNDVVLRDLRQQMGHTHKGQSISIFYGAGHMTDLENRLVNDLRYRRRGELWLTALAVNTRSAGLSQQELRMVQSLVQWQLDALQAK
jgi:hypothetical protein